jgi:hypothetical protein
MSRISRSDPECALRSLRTCDPSREDRASRTITAPAHECPGSRKRRGTGPHSEAHAAGPVLLELRPHPRLLPGAGPGGATGEVLPSMPPPAAQTAPTRRPSGDGASARRPHPQTGTGGVVGGAPGRAGAAAEGAEHRRAYEAVETTTEALVTREDRLALLAAAFAAAPNIPEPYPTTTEARAARRAERVRRRAYARARRR